ncbi:transporter substrate-binding domain-containing protein [Photobacterium sp. GB-72]|uniref:transporter substrate-binding domain-containing protein n=1 Tax=Photobacterium sp. GB-72 TaxID=2022105 RepID=UPI000D170DA2|nr:transporter substrate-binding domain-containing protein [Photobacterium sp. GB-72]PSV30295.1 ABC transporter substrate-binding protein [Photobacterium sp. GB-72]
MSQENTFVIYCSPRLAKYPHLPLLVLLIVIFAGSYSHIAIANTPVTAITDTSKSNHQAVDTSHELTTAALSNKELVIGTYICPPFVMQDQFGEYTGLSILLWQQIAEKLEIPYTFKNYPLKDLLQAVAAKEIDIGLSCLSITPEREQIIDFSHSFYETHLAIVVKSASHFDTFKSIITNRHLLTIIAIFVTAAAIIGGLYYLLEHRVNDKLYSMRSRPAQLIEGFILGLLFITKGPFNYYEFKTLTGRVLTVALAVFTTLFIASITAVLASTFTIGLINSDIKSPNDLANVNTGAKTASTSSQFLTRHSIAHRQYDTVVEMLDALERGEIDAAVNDDAIIKYELKIAKQNGKYEKLTVLPYQFEKQNYGIALIEQSPYEESVNRELLQFRQSNEWRNALLEYFKIK